MRGSVRKLIAVLLFHALWPAFALAQQSPAGVITTLHGSATVARTAVPQEVPLKFKDDVFYKDRISTKESSIVRVLLGGKALVTVRELSVLTITEQPGRATVDLESGKIALAVARKLMRPGEVIEIRTPNAVAAVRGTVVIIEVIQAALGALATTVVNVLNGFATVSLPQAPTVVPVTVQAGQSIPVTGNIFGQLGPVSPTATEGLTPPPPPPSGSPANAQIGANQQAQASLLALALTPPPPQTQVTTTSNPPPSTSSVGINATSSTTTVTNCLQSPQSPGCGSTASPSSGSTTTTTTSPPPSGPSAFFLVDNMSLQLPAGTSLATFSGGAPSQNPTDTSSLICATPPCPLTQLSSPLVSATGPNISLSGPNGGPLIGLHQTTLQNVLAPVPLFSVNGPTNLSTTTFLSLDASMVNVARTIFESTNADVTASGPLVQLKNASTLKSTIGPTVKISGGSLTADALGISDSTHNMFDLTGTVLDISNGAKVTLRALGQEIPDNNRDTVKFNLGSNEPVVRLRSGHLTLTGMGETLVSFGVDTGIPINQGGVALIAEVGTLGTSSLSLKGRLLDLGGVKLTENLKAQIQINGATVTQTGSDPLIDSLGLPVTMAGPLLYVGFNSTVTASGPVVHFGNGSFTSNTLDELIQTGVGDSVKSASNFVLLDGGANVSVPGTLLGATHSTLCSGSTASPCSGGTKSFITVTGGARLTQTGAGFEGVPPLISLSGGNITAGGNFLNVTGMGSQLHLSETLLSSKGTVIKAGSNLVRLVDGGSLFSSTTDHLLLFTGGSYTGGGTFETSSGGALLRMFSQVGQPGTSLTLAGPYLGSSGGATFLSKDVPLFNIADGATVNAGSDFALFGTGSATSASSFFNLANNTSFISPGEPTTFGSGQAPSMTLKGTLIGGANFTFMTQNRGDFLRLRNGVTLDQRGTSSALVALTGTNPGDVIVNAAGNFLSMSAASPAPSLKLGGPLLSALNATLTNGDPTSNVRSFLFLGDSATLTGPTNQPLLLFNASSLDTAGDVLTLRRSQSVAQPTTLTLTGQLLVANKVGATPSTFNTTSLGFGPAFGVANAACCPGFFISQGAQLTAATTLPLIALKGSTFSAGPDAQSGGSFFLVSDQAAHPGEIVAPASVTLGNAMVTAGPLLTATDSTVSALFDLVNVRRSSFATNSASPLVELFGGTLSLGGVDPFTMTPTDAALFNLRGSATGNEMVGGVNLTVGTEQPLKHTLADAATPDPNGFSAPLFQTTDSTVSAPKALKIDTALLVATAPLFNFLKGSGTGSNVTFTNLDPNSGALDLSMKAKVTSLGSALVRLDGSSVTVNKGHFVNVAGGSRLSVAGDLVQLANGSSLNINSGLLLNVTGNSVAQIGTLVRFLNTGVNTSLSSITISNSIAPTRDVTLAGFPVSVPTGASLFVTNPTPIVGLGTSGTVTVSPGGSLLAVSPGSTLRIGP